jgi:hypothetical protein
VPLIAHNSGIRMHTSGLLKSVSRSSCCRSLFKSRSDMRVVAVVVVPAFAFALACVADCSLLPVSPTPWELLLKAPVCVSLNDELLFPMYCPSLHAWGTSWQMMASSSDDTLSDVCGAALSAVVLLLFGSFVVSPSCIPRSSFQGRFLILPRIKGIVLRGLH